MNSLIDALMKKYGSEGASCDGNQIIIDVCEDDLCVKDIPQYIANFECYISRLKEIHWSCDNDKTHILTDELIGKFKEYQDEIAEDYMGYCGEKFKIGFLSSACCCDCQTLPDLLKKLREDTVQMYNVVCCDKALSGIESTLNEVIEDLNKYLYKETQK